MNNATDLYDKRRPDIRFSADLLKLLAMSIMLIDHIGAFLLDQGSETYSVCRSIGRLAFPIFCFLIAEGAHYTRSMPKYMARLAAFAVISTPPYNLVHGSEWYSPDNVNVFFTLLLGLAAIASVSEFPKAVFRRLGRHSLAESQTACLMLGLPFCALCYMSAFWLDTDYGEYGVAAILLFWLLRKRPAAAWLSFAALTFVFFEFFIRWPDAFGVMQYSRINLYNVITKLLADRNATLFFYHQKQMLAPLAFLPCMLYNGKRGGLNGRYSKYMFYAFYPLHLLAIWLIQLSAGV